MAGEILATRVPDEATARRVLEAAFAGDPRLVYEDGRWMARVSSPSDASTETAAPVVEPDRVLLLLLVRRPDPGRRAELTGLAAVRLQADEVVSACGGTPVHGVAGGRLRRAILEMLEGAVPVLHDPPGAIEAIERWLGEPLDGPVSVRLLAQHRLDLPAHCDLEGLAGRLGLGWRGSMELLDQAEVLDACLAALRRPGETLENLRGVGRVSPSIPWPNFGFDRQFLRNLPRVAGTYRFYDRDDGLLYVGKAKDLRGRVSSYFREGALRSRRVQKLLDAVFRIEIEPVGSDLEALLREAAWIRRKKPAANVQRAVRSREDRRHRFDSMLLLEPASHPFVLRAYLLKDGVLVGNIGIGPRGAGLSRIERILTDHFFSVPMGPTPTAGPEVEVEVVTRWLAAHRDRAVAFDPTDLGSSHEVIRRLQWFLDRGSPFEPDGTPILTR